MTEPVAPTIPVSNGDAMAVVGTQPPMAVLTPDDEKRRQEAMEAMNKIKLEFEELRNKLFSEKLEEIKQEITQVEQGNHAELQEEIERLQRVKEDKRLASQRLFELQVETLKLLLDAEQKQAEDECEADKLMVKSKLLNFLNSKQSRLDEERSSFILAEPEADGGKGKRKRKPQVEAPALQAAPRKRINPTVTYPLKEQEIMEDLITINRYCFPLSTARGAHTARRAQMSQ